MTRRPTPGIRALLKGHAGDWRQDTDESRGLPPPAPELPWDPDDPTIDLPAPPSLQLGELPVATAIARRRSRRDFAPEPLTLDTLSYLLWTTQGIRALVHGDDGALSEQYRYVPSAGGCHPFETYLALLRVDNVPTGMYRYLAFEHRLVRLWRSRDPEADMAGACYGSRLIRNAAAVFIWAAVPYRTEWRYGPLAPRLIAAEAGHICQNLYLASESADIGACAIMVYDQARMDELIYADGHNTFAVYLAAVGKPAATASRKRERDAGHTPCTAPVSIDGGIQSRVAGIGGEHVTQAEARRCRGCRNAPCMVATPTNTDIPAFLRAVALGDLETAYEILRRGNALPEMCAYLSPPWTNGEDACSEAGLPGNPIHIGTVQQYVCRIARERGWLPLALPDTASDRRVAVVGGGPAGIACAAGLLERGRRVTIFERDAVLGGAPRVLIPSRRLPDPLPEIDALLAPARAASRLHIEFGRELGRDLNLTELRRTHDAVVLATGLWQEDSLGSAQGVLPSLAFLRDAKSGALASVPERVAVLAGGDCAMDAAVAAQALGARTLYIVYAGTRDQMLWHRDERWFGTRGVHCLTLTEPLGYETDREGRLTGLKTCRTLPAPTNGDQGPAIERLAGSEAVLPVDCVIEAMPLRPVDAIAAIVRDDDGFVAAGALVNGGASVDQCIAEGAQAAKVVHEWLRT